MPDTALTENSTAMEVDMTADEIDTVNKLGGTFYERRRLASSITLDPSTGVDMEELWPSDTYHACKNSVGDIKAVYPSSLFNLFQYLKAHPDYTFRDSEGRNIVKHFRPIPKDTTVIEEGIVNHPRRLRDLDECAGKVPDCAKVGSDLSYRREGQYESRSLMVKIPIAWPTADAQSSAYFLSRPCHVGKHLTFLEFVREQIGPFGRMPSYRRQSDTSRMGPGLEADRSTPSDFAQHTPEQSQLRVTTRDGQELDICTERLTDDLRLQIRHEGAQLVFRQEMPDPAQTSEVYDFLVERGFNLCDREAQLRLDRADSDEQLSLRTVLPTKGQAYRQWKTTDTPVWIVRVKDRTADQSEPGADGDEQLTADED